MGDYLIVGVHSDEEISINKGPPVMKENERYLAVEGIKWVDQVVPNAPYITSLELMEKYNCDFCVHGDDLVVSADGSDTYAQVKEAGKYRECKRTASISTTELVGRMLLMTKEHHYKNSSLELESKSPYTCLSSFFPSTKKIFQFGQSSREPAEGERIVYIDGDFDLFHAGHLELFKRAKELYGEYLIVGIHDDLVTNQIKGSNFPLMNLQERVLSVLACRYVDDIIIGAPFSVTPSLVQQYKISTVIHGKTPLIFDSDGKDPYEFVKSIGIYKEIETSLSYLTVQTIINRIINQRKIYEERNYKKQQREIQHIKSVQ